MPVLCRKLWGILIAFLIATASLAHWLSFSLKFDVLVHIGISCFVILIIFIILSVGIKKIQQELSNYKDLTQYPNPKLLFDQIPIALITVDSNGEITIINSSAREISGIYRENPQNIYDLPCDRESILYYLAQTLEGKQIYDEQQYIYKKNDEQKYFCISTSRIINSQGTFSGAILFARNVSDQLLIKKHVSQHEKLAMIGELAAGTAHEIRNPLTSIRGLIQVLEERFTLEDPAKKHISVMLSEIDRINFIIKELLLLARRTTPNLSFASLPAILDHVLLLVEGESYRRGIQVSKHYNDEFPLIVLDEDQIKQVLLHLATNAIHAMPSGGELNISARYIQPEKIIEITFKDTGTGISEENLQRIFHPFFTTRPEGTGLGLPVSYQIVENHGGKLSVESMVGIGSSFVVKLPIVNYEKTKAS